LQAKSVALSQNLALGASLGAQALVAGAELITRDVRRYRKYFPGLTLIAPTPN